MTLTEQLADFIFNCNYENIPANAITAAKTLLMDTLGVTLAGAQHQSCKAILEVIREERTHPDSTVLVYGDKTSCRNASLINGTMATVLDFDDTHDVASIHSGAVSIPVALALGEQFKKDGKTLITALVTGYEVHSRIGLAAKIPCGLSGWHTSSITAVFAAVATAGKILNLNRDQLVNALGIAFSLASGNMQSGHEGTWAKYFQPGIGAQNGILAARLAEKGFTGPKEALEANFGFFNLYLREYDVERAWKEFGERLEITRASFKPYPSCRSAQSAIGVCLDLMKEFDLNSDKIAKVKVKVTSPCYSRVGLPIDKNVPLTTSRAKLSIPFSVAVAMLYKKTPLAAFEGDSLKNALVMNLARKVEVCGDPEMDKEYGRVTICPAEMEITTVDGRSYVKKAFPKGSPKNPMTPFEMKEKFHDCALSVYSEDKINDVIHLIETIEEITDISNFVAQLVVKQNNG